MASTTARLQTPPGLGGIAVIALAGPQTPAILEKVFRPLPAHAQFGPGRLQLGKLLREGEVIDEAIVCRDGELAEINIHGGPAVAQAAMEALAAAGADVQPAKPSAPESFSAGHPRWDNPAIGQEMLEAIAQASSPLVLSALTQQWSAGLSQLAAEALAGGGNSDWADRLRQAAGGLAAMHRLLKPAEVVLVGPPNVGKSTLANALVGRPVSIVHATPGTTRDWVREPAILHGVPIFLTDTAGLWSAARGVDAEAVRRARARAEQADLVVVLAAEELVDTPPWLHAGKVLRISAKADICPPAGPADVVVSAANGTGLDRLVTAVLEAIGLGGFDPARPMAFTGRQEGLLVRAAGAMDKADSQDACDLLRRLLGR